MKTVVGWVLSGIVTVVLYRAMDTGAAIAFAGGLGTRFAVDVGFWLHGRKGGTK